MSRQVPHAEDTATGTPTAGLVPISAGPGLAPAWGAAGGGGGSGAGPLCVVYLATGYDLANGSGARNDVAWDAEDTDTTGMHDLVTHPERITIATAGWYDLRYQVEWANDASNDKPRHAFLMLNGTHQLHHVDQDTQTDNSSTGQGGACLMHLNAGDYVTLQLEQESGFTQYVRGVDDVGSPPNRPTQMSVCMVGGGGGGAVALARCQLTRTTNLTMVAGSYTTVPWDSEREDVGGLHSTGTNPDRVTVTEAGLYLLEGRFRFHRVTGTTTSQRMWSAFFKNDTDVIDSEDWFSIGQASSTTGPDESQFSMVATHRLAVGDYVNVQMANEGNGTVDLVVGAADNQTCEFVVTRLGG
jgi:hypothetical protein